MMKKIVCLIASTFFATSISYADINSANTVTEFKPVVSKNDDEVKSLIFAFLIGRKVAVPAVTSALYEHESLSGLVLVSDAASEITVSITDQEGNLLKTMNLGAKKGTGLAEFKWDGCDLNGRLHQPGLYTISAAAVINGKQRKLSTAGIFKVDSISAATNNIVLNLDGVGGVRLQDLVRIY